ncbi:MAG TPA: PD-(D/E)XK nuclease family protein [Phycisphaerales bacterium]|nr:PD-(D/E)XK nuclease family protein [Phycisphaerales bacterium]HMP37784.1 PD-(D/E)XK nuclease family protein [Phycisphaerales bacterium]
MNARRIVLRWEALALPQVAEWLIDTASAGGASGPPGEIGARAEEHARRRAPHASASGAAERSGAAEVIDLGRTAVVLPGARAGRLLLWHLARRAEALGARIVPPMTLTPGSMVDALLDDLGPCATPLAFECAIAEALRDPSTEAAPSLIAPALVAPATGREDHGALAALETARVFAAIVDELAGEGIAASRVVETLEEMAREAAADGAANRETDRGQDADPAGSPAGKPDGNPDERPIGGIERGEMERWEALGRIEESASRRLARCGMSIRSRHAWSRTGAPERPHPSVDRLVLALVPELNGVQRRAIARFARSASAAEDAVFALVHADERWLAELDELGALRRIAPKAPEARPDEEPLVAEAELIVAESAADAAQCAIAETLAGRRCEPDPRVTVGLLDPPLGDALEHAGAYAGISFRTATGRSVATTEPAATIEAIARWLDGDRDPSEFARLPAVGAWLRGALELAGEGERGSEAVPVADVVARLDESMRASRPGGDQRVGSALARSAAAAIDAALAPLLSEDDGRTAQGDPDDGAQIGGPHARAALPRSLRSLVEWAERIRTVLATLLAGIERSDLADEAIDAVVEELGEWGALDARIAPRLGPVGALRLLARRLGRRALPAPTRRGEVEALGLLELHPDDAPAVILLGLHEGAVPRARTSDPFLPGALRSRLGLADDDFGARRDRYLLAALRRGRRSLRAIVARRSASGDPLLASRLLLEIPRAQQPRRLRHLAGAGARRFDVPSGLAAPAPRSRFVVPSAPSGPVTLDRIAVTAFRAYLACPFRYWLERHLRLKRVDPVRDQLDAAEFGTVAHAALARWGTDSLLRDSTDGAAIAAALGDALDDEVRRAFPGGAPVAALVQAARLRQRFDAFAAFQAAHRSMGWRIERIEWDLPETASLEIPGQAPVRITGRIDRIDRHERTGELLLIDYKTADLPRMPEAVHRRAIAAPGAGGPQKEWIDLQLPLYGHLAAKLLAARPDAQPDVQPGARPDVQPDARALAPQLAYMLLPRDASATRLAEAAWSDDERSEAIERAQRVVAKIRAGEFPINPGYAGADRFVRICHGNALIAEEAGAPGDPVGAGGAT